MKDSASCYLSLLATSFRSGCARRIAFLLSAGMMVANNILFFVTWWIIYQRVPTIGGWAYEDMQLLWALSTTSFGLTVTLFGGVRRIAHDIADGALDPYLLKPRDVLFQLACSRCSVSGFGDIITGLFFFSISINSLSELVFVPLFVATGTAILFSTAVLAHSIAFWVRGMEETSDLAFNSMLLFSSYPGSIYTGWGRFLLFTILPAGFMSLLPVEAIRSVNLFQAAAIVCAALGYLALACFVFSRGLGRYESGSRIELGARR